MIANGPTARGFRKLRKFTEAREYECLYRTGMADMIAENTSKDKTKPMGFTITRGSSPRHGIYRSGGDSRSIRF